MKTISFEEATLYTPYTACIPLQWEGCSFETLDFEGKEPLQNFLLAYFENMAVVGKDSLSRDSLVLCIGDFAYQLHVAMYKTLAARLPAEVCKFVDWLPYLARIKAQYAKGDELLLKDMASVNYLFLFDVSLSTEDARLLLLTILKLSYNRATAIFICTRLTKEDLQTMLGVNFTIMKNKCALVAIK